MSSVRFLLCVFSRTNSMTRLSSKASYSPLSIIGPARAKQMDSQIIVSMVTMATAPMAPNRAGT